MNWGFERDIYCNDRVFIFLLRQAMLIQLVVAIPTQSLDFRLL